MLKNAREIATFYLKNGKSPIASEIDVQSNYFETAKPQFITFYKEWKVLASSWTIKATEKSTWEELTKNILALLKDKRLKWFKVEDLENIKIRFDEITERKPLDKKDDIWVINSKTSGVVVVKNDYSRLACLLPDISSSVKDEKSMKKVLDDKLGEKYQRKNYVVYEILTNKEMES